MPPHRRARPKRLACVAATAALLAAAVIPGGLTSPVLPRAAAPGARCAGPRAIPTHAPSSLPPASRPIPSTRGAQGLDHALPARPLRTDQYSHLAPPHQTLNASSTQWVTTTENFSLSSPQVTHVPSGWLPPNRTAWYQRKAMFMSSFFLAVFIVLLIGAMVTLYDHDQTLDVEQGMTEEETVEYILRSRIQREQEKAQHAHESQTNRRERWRRLRARTTAMATRPLQLSRRQGHNHLLQHFRRRGRLHGHPRLLHTEARPSILGQSTMRESSPQRGSGLGSPSPSRISHVSYSSGFDPDHSVPSCSDLEHSGPRAGSLQSCTLGEGTSLTEEDRELAERYILQRIAMLQAELSEWEAIREGSVSTTTAGADACHLGMDSAAAGHHSPILSTDSQYTPIRVRRTSNFSPSSREHQELSPPAYLPSNPSQPPSVQMNKPHSAPTHNPGPVPSSPSDGRVTMAHVATDDKVVLSALRLGRSAPTSTAAPHAVTAASAPPLHYEVGMPSSSDKGREIEVSDCFPAPSSRVEPAFDPFYSPRGLPSSDEEKTHLALLLSAPSMPSAPQTPHEPLPVVPSAPLLELWPPPVPEHGHRRPGVDL